MKQDYNFEDIIEQNKEQIYRICKIYAKSPQEPQDLFQEVIFQIWKSLDSFKGKSHINTWVYRIALNVGAKSRLKSIKKEKLEVRFEAIEIVASDKPEDEAYKEKFEALRTCMNMLKGIDQSILALYLEDLPYKEIADITGISDNHVAVKMKRIRETLFNCIKPKLK